MSQRNLHIVRTAATFFLVVFFILVTSVMIHEQVHVAYSHGVSESCYWGWNWTDVRAPVGWVFATNPTAEKLATQSATIYTLFAALFFLFLYGYAWMKRNGKFECQAVHD